jgi:hypothetical protein
MARNVQRLARMATTGDKCERSGLYFVSGACGHASQRAVQRNESLPCCYICGRPTTWTLLREFSASAEDTDGMIGGWDSAG